MKKVLQAFVILITLPLLVLSFVLGVLAAVAIAGWSFAEDFWS